MDQINWKRGECHRIGRLGNSRNAYEKVSTDGRFLIYPRSADEWVLVDRSRRDPSNGNRYVLWEGASSQKQAKRWAENVTNREVC